MCDGMNRSLGNVIMGGFGTSAGMEHKEIKIDVNGMFNCYKMPIPFVLFLVFSSLPI